MSMIHLEDGTMQFHGIKIFKEMRVEDFEKYKRSVTIDRIREGEAIITLNHPVENNGIDAEVTIFLNEENHTKRVNIFPCEEEKGLLESSKKWIKGLIPREKLEITKNSLSASFPWGTITAQYLPDPHYGKVGGDIDIMYKRED